MLTGNHYYFIIILLNCSSLFNLFKLNNSGFNFFKKKIILIIVYIKKINLLHDLVWTTNLLTHEQHLSYLLVFFLVELGK